MSARPPSPLCPPPPPSPPTANRAPGAVCGGPVPGRRAGECRRDDGLLQHVLRLAPGADRLRPAPILGEEGVGTILLRTSWFQLPRHFIPPQQSCVPRVGLFGCEKNKLFKSELSMLLFVCILGFTMPYVYDRESQSRSPQRPTKGGSVPSITMSGGARAPSVILDTLNVDGPESVTACKVRR